jgi:TolA-binding protein
MAGDRDAGRKTLEKFVRRYPQDANVSRAQALLGGPAFSSGSTNAGHPNS